MRVQKYLLSAPRCSSIVRTKESKADVAPVFLVLTVSWGKQGTDRQIEDTHTTGPSMGAEGYDEHKTDS
jgi:hypothetical protein